MKYSDALLIAKKFVELLRGACTRIEIVGSVRREKAEVHDIELLMIAINERPVPEFGKPKQLFATKLDKVLSDLEYQDVIRQASDKKDGPKYKKRAIVGTGEMNEFCLDLFIVTRESWGVQSVIRTGPSDFSHWMVTKKMDGGALPDECYVKDGFVWNGVDGSKYDTPEEEDFFRLCGLEWVKPGQRGARWRT